jgi:DNA repair exonuclease SbcCD nuclease subunit
MRLVHLSDLHLGFRQYQRLTPGGINQREADVGHAFRSAIDRTIALAPNLVVVGGDVFHAVRPPNPAILHAFTQFSRLRRELPEATIVIVAGNHDVPRASETGCILRLFSPLGIEVADAEPRRIRVPELDLSVLAVPDTGAPRPALTPDPSARYNVLLLHGEVAGVLPPALVAGDRARAEITTEELNADRWNYVALGHYHVYRRVAPNAWYAGSIEYTSPNPWGELAEERDAGIAGKGLIEHDLATGAHRFHPLDLTRPMLDLPPVPARGLTAADLDARIRATVEGAPIPIDGAVVRLVVRDVPRHIARELDHAALRDYKRRALHFHLDTRRPELRRVHASAVPGRRPSLAEVVREHLVARALEPDLDRAALVDLGLGYLRAADAIETTASDAMPVGEAGAA